MENIKGTINELSTYYTDAYGIAVANGFKGTVAEWLDSLVGKSAYDIAVMQGFKGTEKEWIASLKADADRAEAAVAEAVTDAETAAAEAHASADEAKTAAAEAEASAEQTAKYHGMKEVGRATIKCSLNDLMKMEFGGQPIDTDTRSVTLALWDGGGGTIVEITHPSLDALLQLFRESKIVEIRVPYDEDEYSDILCEDNITLERVCGGIYYYDSNYIENPGNYTKTTHISYQDSPYNPGRGYYVAYRLQLSSTFVSALPIALERFTEADITFVGYN